MLDVWSEDGTWDTPAQSPMEPDFSNAFRNLKCYSLDGSDSALQAFKAVLTYVLVNGTTAQGALLIWSWFRGTALGSLRKMHHQHRNIHSIQPDVMRHFWSLKASVSKNDLIQVVL